MAPTEHRTKGASSDAARGRRRVVELVAIVAAALALAFVVQALLVKTYRIPSPSMVPTLAVGQRILVNRIGMRFGDPKVGDIVVFHPPAGADASQPVCGDPTQGWGMQVACSRPTDGRSRQTFVKRVVGVGGDRLRIEDGHVIRNGRAEPDAYVRSCAAAGVIAVPCDFRGAITVPEGSFYMMGDNRGESDDSRFWGPVPKRWLVGTAFATYWPPKRIGAL